MTVQNFKGDATELKMQEVGNPLFSLTDAALNSFYADGFDSSPFLLMLYDERRVPFSDRIPRAAFVDFVKEALIQFPVTGTFESYLFILRAVFGADSEITFDIPAPGKLEIDVRAVAFVQFEFIGREFVGGSSYEFFNMTDDDGNLLIFRGVPGISTEYELNLLFSETMPAGISPTISLQFFVRSEWIADNGDATFSEVIDHVSNNIIFYEIGG